VIPAANKSLVFKVSPSGRYLPGCLLSNLGWRVQLWDFHGDPSRSNAHAGKRMKESKSIQQPQNHGNDYYAVQN
jgi:hypothetical protein